MQINRGEMIDDTRKARTARIQQSVKLSTDIQDPSDPNQISAKIEPHGCQIEQSDLDYIIMDGDLQLSPEERKLKLADAEDLSPKLHLEISSKFNFSEGFSALITSVGIKGSLRKAGDGVTYFGSVNKESSFNELNDFLIAMPDSDKDDRNLGRHFQIYYSLAETKYYIRDLGRGFGAFMKIGTSYVLKSDSLINIGDAYIVVSFGDEETQQNSEKSCLTSDTSLALHLKVYSGTQKIEPL